jgi:LDH2 family malate/lactate/ureidoglycolate dehydrogenase
MDNKGAIDLTTAISGTKRSKHIDIRLHYTRDMAEQGIILIRQIPARDMVADGLTKPLGPDAHTLFLRQLGLSQ